MAKQFELNYSELSKSSHSKVIQGIYRKENIIIKEWNKIYTRKELENYETLETINGIFLLDSIKIDDFVKEGDKICLKVGRFDLLAYKELKIEI